MGKGSAILVIASDLHEEAPIWWLRVQAGRQTRRSADRRRSARPPGWTATPPTGIRYAYGEEAASVRALLPGQSGTPGAAAEAFAKAENAVIFYGSEGLGLAGSEALAQACTALLIANRPRRASPTTAWSPSGRRPTPRAPGIWVSTRQPTWQQTLAGAGLALYGAPPTRPAMTLPWRQPWTEAGFVVVQELFLTETARRRTWSSRCRHLPNAKAPSPPASGACSAFTRPSRRAPAPGPILPSWPTWPGVLGLQLEGRSAAMVFARIAAQLPAYAGLTYQKLAETAPQWPIVGRQDLYYGGTTYDNHQGLGVQLATGGAARPACSSCRRRHPAGG